MNRNIIGSITDQTGHTVAVRDGEKYTVVYKDKEGNVKIQTGTFHNYPADQYIGKDDEEGWSHGVRVYFNGGRADDKGIHGVIPIVVVPDQTFINEMKKVFHF